MPGTIVDIFHKLQDDSRLQKNWERNQSRIDRSLESVLIARTSREVATAALLSAKLRYEPAAEIFLNVDCDVGLLSFAREQGIGGRQLANLIEHDDREESTVIAAAIHALRFYRDRSDSNGLVRLAWSHEGLQRLATARTDQIFVPRLRPTWAERKAVGLRELAALLSQPVQLDGDTLRARLRAVSGLGPERADAVGVFGFHQGWPIVDEYLWRLLCRHGILAPQQLKVSGYDRRRQEFDPHWRTLVKSSFTAPDELAATLYLWACEAERFGYTYALERRESSD